MKSYSLMSMAGGHTIVLRTFDEGVTMILDHMNLSGN